MMGLVDRYPRSVEAISYNLTLSSQVSIIVKDVYEKISVFRNINAYTCMPKTASNVMQILFIVCAGYLYQGFSWP